MNRHVDTERVLDAFLAPEHEQLAERVVEAAFAEIARTPQRRAVRAPWRLPSMPALSRATGLAAVAVVAAVATSGLIYIAANAPSRSYPSASSTTPAPSTAPRAPSTEPTTSPATSGTFAPTTPPLVETDLWTPFTSPVYGYSMKYPAGWKIDHRSTRPWATADGMDFSSPGVDTFTSADGSLGVSVWGVPIDSPPDPSVGLEWEDFEAWITSFCITTESDPCSGVHDRVVPMCPDADSECHTGAIIVPLSDSVVGFKGGDRGGITAPGDSGDVTYWIVVSVWQPESFPGLAEYGGGIRLIQAFLESMGAEMPSRGPVGHANHP